MPTGNPPPPPAVPADPLPNSSHLPAVRRLLDVADVAAAALHRFNERAISIHNAEDADWWRDRIFAVEIPEWDAARNLLDTETPPLERHTQSACLWIARRCQDAQAALIAAGRRGDTPAVEMVVRWLGRIYLWHRGWTEPLPSNIRHALFGVGIKENGDHTLRNTEIERFHGFQQQRFDEQRRLVADYHSAHRQRLLRVWYDSGVTVPSALRERERWFTICHFRAAVPYITNDELRQWLSTEEAGWASQAADVVPDAIRSWLQARYLSDPCPDVVPLHPERQPEPAVFIPFDRFADFLTSGGTPLLSTLDACRAAGLIDDMRIDLFETDGPTCPLPPWQTRCIQRLQLAIGQEHRLVAIRMTVLDSPTQVSASAQPALEMIPHGEAKGEPLIVVEPEVPAEESRGNWQTMGEAKRTVLTVLKRAGERMHGPAIAERAGSTHGTLRHHFGDLQRWGYVDRGKDGYAITPAGVAVMPPCESV